ncbi:CPBP family intramembrane glutamic endopeptidase [Kineococcus gynurae]|uniref:CPBP family intramembrane glutamic endopeptidase n=1 Tax=Kineococcus gynurae TaxID=452979 RepID=A0ABV5LRJ6_9ACTN
MTPVPESSVATRSPSRRRLLVSLGLGAFLCVAVYGGAPVDSVGGVDLRLGLDGPSAGDPWKWLGAILVVLVVLVVERRGPDSLLLRRPSRRDLEWVLYAFGIVMAWSWVAGLVVAPTDDTGVLTIVALGVPGVLVLVVTAAVTEEIVYRGFLAERLGALLGPGAVARWVGAGVVLAVFTAPHVAFFGPSWLVLHLPGAAALTLVVLLRRNLCAAMLLHLLINLPILVPVLAAG